MPGSSASVRICPRSAALTVPSVIGMSYACPVRLSVTVRGPLLAAGLAGGLRVVHDDSFVRSRLEVGREGDARGSCTGCGLQPSRASCASRRGYSICRSARIAPRAPVLTVLRGGRSLIGCDSCRSGECPADGRIPTGQTRMPTCRRASRAVFVRSRVPPFRATQPPVRALRTSKATQRAHVQPEARRHSA